MSRRLLVALIVATSMAVLLPCFALDLGLFVGQHCVSPFPTYWTLPEELLLRQVAVVGIQAEQGFGAFAGALRVGCLADYAVTAEPWNGEMLAEYRIDLFGVHSRVSGTRRLNLLTDMFWTHAGIAVACDYYRVTSRGEKTQVTGALTQSVTAGLRTRTGSRPTAGMDVDLNLVREGFSHYFFEDTGPSPYWFYRLGTMEPSIALSMTWSL
jgi:hypothetical protein